MAIRVVSLGHGETHIAATHYVIDPQGILHIYTGDAHTASYRDWSGVVVSQAPPGTPVPAEPVPEPSTDAPNVVVLADTGTDAKAAPKRRKTGNVPRGGFGS